MRIGPKALVGLGLPAALRPHAPDKGVGADVLRSRVDNQPLISRSTNERLVSRSGA